MSRRGVTPPAPEVTSAAKPRARAKKSPAGREVASTEATQASRSDVELYNEVADRARLGSIKLLSLEYNLVTQWDSEDQDKDRPNLLYEVKFIHVDVTPERGLAAALLTCEVDAIVPSGDKFLCQARYFVAYENIEGCDARAAEAFIRRVGKFTCYPYFRSLVSTIDWAAETGLPPLPILRERPPGTRKAVNPAPSTADD